MSDATVADRRLHPATVPLRFLKTVPSTVIGLPAVFAFMTDIGLGRALIIIGLSATLMVFATWLGWWSFRFGVGGQEVVIESGLLSRNRRTIPFARIHDIDIERGPLERLFGLAKVRIETGGAGKDEGLLDSLSLAEADAMRSAIRAGKGAPLEVAAAEERPPLFTMEPGRVLLSGLFNFSLVWIAALFGLLQSFDDWLPFDLYDWGRWLGLAERGAARFTPGMIASALLLAGLLGLLTGVLRTLARDYGYRLTAEPNGLRRVRGLFTRTEAVIPKRRIQLAVVGAGLVRRSLGWRSLSLQTLGAGAGESGRQDAAPFAREDEVAAVLVEAGRFRLPAAEELQRVSLRHVTKGVLGFSLIPVPQILVIAYFYPPALLLLLGVPLFVIGAIFERRSHLYALSGELLFVQRGFWDRRLWIAPVARIQSLSLRRSWLQRRLGLATLVADTAGAPAMGGVRIVDLPEPVAIGLIEQLAPARSVSDASLKSSCTEPARGL